MMRDGQVLLHAPSSCSQTPDGAAAALTLLAAQAAAASTLHNMGLLYKNTGRLEESVVACAPRLCCPSKRALWCC